MYLKRIVLAGAALSASFSAISGDGYVSVDRDRFTQSTTMDYATPGNRFNQLYFMVHAIQKGDDSTARLSFLSGSERWKYLDCHDLKWLVDGNPLELPSAYHKGSVMRGGVTETVSQRVTAEQLIQIGAAQIVEYRLCFTEGKLSTTEIRAAGEIGAKLISLSPSAAKP